MTPDRLRLLTLCVRAYASPSADADERAALYQRLARDENTQPYPDHPSYNALRRERDHED